MHILHLEDDPPLQEILRVALTCAQPVLKLVQFNNSDRAVEYIVNHHHEIHLYILDIRVPGGRDGLEVAKFIRALGSDTPILITSAYRQPSQELLTSMGC